MTLRSAFNAKVGAVLALTFLDVVLNALADHAPVPGGPAWLPLVWLGAQLALILLTAAAFAMLVFDTYLFQVGLIGVLAREFRALFGGLAAYLLAWGAYAAVKAFLLLGPPRASEDGLWDAPLFVALSVLQKLASFGYYALVLAYAAKLGEGRWYSRAYWVREFSAKGAAAGGEGAAPGAAGAPAGGTGGAFA